MSTSEQALVTLLSRFALSFDGAVLGAALAYAAVRTVLKLTASCSSLNELRKAPYVSVSDLRHIIPDGDSGQSESDRKLVVVRGTVEARSSVEGNWKSLLPNVLISQESGDRAVIIQRTQVVTPLVFLLRFCATVLRFCFFFCFFFALAELCSLEDCTIKNYYSSVC